MAFQTNSSNGQSERGEQTVAHIIDTDGWDSEADNGWIRGNAICGSRIHQLYTDRIEMRPCVRCHKEANSVAALTLSICKIMDKGGDDFSMGIFGIDQSCSDADPDCVGIAQDIYESINRNQNDEVYGDYSDTDCDPILERLSEDLKLAMARKSSGRC